MKSTFNGLMRYKWMLTTAMLTMLTSSSYCQSPAPQRPTQVTPAPNYGLTSAKTNPAYLTDGKLSGATNIWTDPATLGWMDTDMITLDFDLGSRQTLRAVSVHSARGAHADVSYPMGVYVFASTDNRQFRYLGNAVKLNDELTGAYATRDFKLTIPGISARYVMLKVVPGGKYFFTDEVRIQRDGSPGQKGSALPAVARANMDDYVEKLTASSYSKRQQQAGVSPGRGTTSSRPARAFNPWSSGATGSNAAARSATSKSAGAAATSAMSATESDISLSPIIGGVDYSGFLVTNSGSAGTMTISLKDDVPGAHLSLFETYFVNQQNFSRNLDPLIPVPLSSRINIGAGESKYFIVRATGVSGGSRTSAINITLPGGQYSIPMKIYVPASRIDLKSNRLNAVNWAYFNLPALKGMTAEVREDLLAHHINTMTIAPSVVPPIDRPDNDGYFRDHLANSKGFDNMLLYLDLTKKLQKDRNFFNDAWKRQFLAWYDHVMGLVKQAGLGGMQVYVFPYDEAKAAEAQALIAFSRWIRQARPGVKIYATSIHDGVTQQIMPYVDVVQILDRKGPFNSASRKTSGQSQIWLYDTKAPASSLAPHQYYRLLGWKAFARNLGGVGFWNYIYGEQNDLGARMKSRGVKLDNSVIYTDNGKIVTTRRWEAFRQGMEEYAILKTYAARFGQQKAMQLCQQVLQNESDADRADAVRLTMLQQLK